jgi:hypothetical protein
VPPSRVAPYRTHCHTCGSSTERDGPRWARNQPADTDAGAGPGAGAARRLAGNTALALPAGSPGRFTSAPPPPPPPPPPHTHTHTHHHPPTHTTPPPMHHCQPAPHLCSGNLGGGGILHQVVQRHAAGAAKPRRHVSNAHGDVVAQRGLRARAFGHLSGTRGRRTQAGSAAAQGCTPGGRRRRGREREGGKHEGATTAAGHAQAASGASALSSPAAAHQHPPPRRPVGGGSGWVSACARQTPAGEGQRQPCQLNDGGRGGGTRRWWCYRGAGRGGGARGGGGAARGPADTQP